MIDVRIKEIQSVQCTISTRPDRRSARHGMVWVAWVIDPVDYVGAGPHELSRRRDSTSHTPVDEDCGCGSLISYPISFQMSKTVKLKDEEKSEEEENDTFKVSFSLSQCFRVLNCSHFCLHGSKIRTDSRRFGSRLEICRQYCTSRAWDETSKVFLIFFFGVFFFLSLLHFFILSL